MDDMSTATLSINYDGPDLETGEMEVADLAPALLALGKLFEEANRVINGEKSHLSVKVKAGFKAGSFEVDLHILQGWISNARDLLVGNTATALANLFAFLGVSGTITGLFAFLKSARGRRPTRLIVLADGNVEVHLPPDSFSVDGDTLVVPAQTIELFRDLRVRRAAAAAVKPLEREGISEISLRPSGTPKSSAETRVTKNDLAAFRAPDAGDSLIVDSKSTAAFSIVSLTFNEDGKWKLSDGQNVVWATIEDQEFLAAVDRNEISFAKGDILLCDVVVQQWQTDGGLKTETRIIKVREHKSAMRQISLPFG